MNALYLTLALIVAFAIPTKAADEITARIGSGSVEIAKDQAEAEQFRDHGTRSGGIVLVCKRIQLQRDASAYLVTCTDVKLLTAAGVEAIASEAKFDLQSNRIWLSGTKAKPVEIIRDATRDADMTRMTAENIEMQLTPFHRPRDKN